MAIIAAEAEPLAIYCFAWQEGGAEKRKLGYQEKVGLIYAWRTGRSDRECRIYRDISGESHWALRPAYERLKQDIHEERIGEVWALGFARLHPFGTGQEALEVLCRSRNVKLTVGLFGEKVIDFDPPFRKAV
ncbi:MAG: hypothetical protein ABSG17_02590 [Spirochaetia bacterium]|jgi:hypothetical protein